MLRHQILKHLLRDMRLEDPHGPVLAVDGRRALADVAVFLLPLPFPGFILVVVLPDAVVEIAGSATDDLLLPGVRPSKPAGTQPPEVLVRTHDDHRLPKPLRLHRRDHGRGGPAINDNVMILPGKGREDGSKGNEKCAKFNHHRRIGTRPPNAIPQIRYHVP